MSLGRGLESLIPDRSSEEIPDNSVAELPEESKSPQPEEPKARTYHDNFTPRRADSVFWIEIEKIEANPFQPRREFDPEALQDLASSIREHGILQPILVAKRQIETPSGLDVRYQLIAGERRWRAAQLAGISQLPAVIRRGMPDDKIKLELALIENVQREDLNPIEKAKAFKQLLDEFHMVHREIASRVGKSREMVSNTIRLLSLPSDIQDGVSTGRITEGHGRAILMVGDDQAKQYEMYNAILDNRLNVREAENRARQVSGRTLVPRKRPVFTDDPELKEWENKLQEKLGTKVHFQKMGQKGKIVMEFYSEEELKSLLDKLVQPQTPTYLN